MTDRDDKTPLDMNVPLDFSDDDGVELPADPAFDAWIGRAAAGVNVPAETPRAEMYDAIVAAQMAAAEAQEGNVAGVLPLRRRPWFWPAAVAAALLAGIGVDRMLVQHRGAGPTGANSPAGGRVATNSSPESAPSAGAEGRLASGEESALSTPSASSAFNRSSSSLRTLVAPSVEGSARVQQSPTPDQNGSANLYRLAAVQTLSQAEALLTAYRASGVADRDPAAAKQLGTWGRSVLSSTRLLIDSPAGDDPQLRPLLEDLELVLVQVIRLSGTPLDASERALIDRALRERDLLPRIRTAVPAGAVVGVTEE